MRSVAHWVSLAEAGFQSRAFLISAAAITLAIISTFVEKLVLAARRGHFPGRKGRCRNPDEKRNL